MEIREFRADSITDAVASQLAELQTLVDPRRLRTDPPVPAQLAVDRLLKSTKTYAFTYWGIFDGPQLVGFGEVFGAIGAENADVAEVGIWMHPDHDSGPGKRQLFDHIDTIERARGRVRYWGWGDAAHEPSRAFWEGELGYTEAYDERISRCALGDVDQELMESWIAKAAERASGYHLLRLVAPFDDEGLDYFATALEGMNDAPLDDLVHEPEHFDRQRAREIQALQMQGRSIYQAVLAVHTESGELGGYTAIRIPAAEPRLSRQSDTVTIPAHRGRGIGRWIKADMWKWLRETRPDVEYLDTGNAESNRAMLAINEAMGFRDVLHHVVWHKADDQASAS